MTEQGIADLRGRLEAGRHERGIRQRIRGIGRGARLLLAGALLSGLVGGAARAAEEAAPSPLTKRSWEWGLVGAYGSSNDTGASVSGVNLGFLGLQAGYAFAETHGPAPLRGSFEVIGEAIPVFFAYRKSGVYGLGLNAGLRYNVATGSPWVPFLDALAGILVTTSRPPDGDPGQMNQFKASQFNFLLAPGVGVRYQVSPRVALSLEYRYFHYSDAEITRRNPGLNGNMVVVGFSLFR